MENLSSKSLRIGNIVRSKVNGISKVEQIGSSINSEYVGGRSLEGNYWENSYLPIEITEKWLIDLGFRKDEETNYRWFMEDWLGENKDIWNHPIITDRNDLESYEVADLMAEFANSVISNEYKTDECMASKPHYKL